MKKCSAQVYSQPNQTDFQMKGGPFLKQRCRTDNSEMALYSRYVGLLLTFGIFQGVYEHQARIALMSNTFLWQT